MQIGVIIGRFNPVHTGHYELFKKALQENDKIIIVIGSANCAPSPKNPLSVSERIHLIKLGFDTLSDTDKNRILYKFVQDSPYSDLQWLTSVTKLVNSECSKTDIITLYGCEKDQDTTEYLSMFTMWSKVFLKPSAFSNTLQGIISATNIRNEIFSKGLAAFDTTLVDVYNNQQREWLEEWICSSSFDNIQKDFEYYKHYNEIWKQAPFPPVFITCDAIVLCNNHVLVIKRKRNPGINLLAMPGGFLNNNELIRDGILRELCEETKIHNSVPFRVLDAKLSSIKTFDYPQRSLRGRVITNVGIIKLTEKQLPKVEAADDAKEVFWVPIMHLSQMSSLFFEDHFHILTSYL